MQTFFFAAGVLALLTGLAHSVLGEILIFRHLRNTGFVPSMGAPPLRERNIRIIWATWHLASVFGWAFAGILLGVAFMAENDCFSVDIVLSAIIFAYLGGSVLVLVGTKGRHPGWIALLVVAALAWFATSAA